MPGDFTLACIVLAYHKPEQLGLLLSVLRHPRVRLYLHVDRRTPIAPFAAALSRRGLDDVVLLPRHRSGWGSIKCVDASLDGLRYARTDGCDYFMMISEQDLPLRPIAEIVEFARTESHRSYVHHWPISASDRIYGGRDRTDFYTYTVRGRREVCIPRGQDTSYFGWKGLVLNDLLRARSALKPARRFPSYARPFVGATWWNLNPAAVDQVFSFTAEHPDYRLYHRYTFIPEEMFIQSILVGTEFASHHEIVNDPLRFLDVMGRDHPRILTTEDLPTMLASGKLFARKFDDAVDPAVISRLVAHVSPAHAADLAPDV